MSRSVLPLLLAFALPVALRAQAAPAPKLTDPQIAHIVVTADNIDIDAGKFAESKTKNASVKQFATMMVNDHGAVNAQAVALVTKLGVTPADNDVSKSLLAGAAKAHAVQVPLTGNAFDVAYMDREIAYHQAVLDAIDKALIPDASNAELKALLVQVRPAIAGHLAAAKTTRAGLKPAP